MTATDRVPMRLALDLAAQAIGLCEPNPRVGCVLTDSAGREIGRGHTQRAGEAHAEVMALRDARSRGYPTAGATAYVTLEPCSHHGRTGPCCDALLQAGVRRVVASIADPNPRVQGEGFRRLRAGGVDVEVGPGAQQSRELNLGFFSRMLRRTPWVRLKSAASLDGKTALDDGTSQWITSEAARADGHAWRMRAGALLTGIGTIRRDNPRLDVRLHAAAGRPQPALAIVDSRLQTPPDARVFVEGRQVLVYAAVRDAQREAALARRGAMLVFLPGSQPGTASQVDLRAMLADLATREVNELHVEAGHTLNGALLRDHLVDELLVYLAPKLIGQGRGMASFGPLADLGQALALEFVSNERVGEDLRIVARLAGRDRFPD